MAQPFTRADYERLPEGFPAQLVAGTLVEDATPTYRHQRIGARIRQALAALVGPDRVPDTPAAVAVDETNVYHPDLVVLRAPVREESSYVGVPLLVVEVLSPSTRARDREVKSGRLLACGVEEVWLVDPDAASIEVRRRGASTTLRGAEVARSRALAGFALVPDALFSAPRIRP